MKVCFNIKHQNKASIKSIERSSGLLALGIKKAYSLIEPIRVKKKTLDGRACGDRASPLK